MFVFFKNVLGAIHGTYMLCVVSTNEQIKFIGMKGHSTQKEKEEENFPQIIHIR